MVSTAPSVSVAVSLYNEEEVFPELLRRLTAVLDGLPGGPHQIVFVDDGSSDGTFDKVTAAAADDSRIVGLSLSRNFGHQAALSAALDYASADAVIVMDGDLQDPPEEIPRFLDEFRKGFDVVFARRTDRKEPWALRVCYYVFYRMIAALSDVRLPLDAGDFGLLSRRVVEKIRTIREHHKYLRGLRTWVGFRQIGIPVKRGERAAGRSQYTFGKLLRLAFDGIFAFSMAPLRGAAILGFLVIACSLAYAIYAIYVKLALGKSPPGFTALILVVSLFSGTQLLFLGIIGEYVGRVYEETKGRPQYIVAKEVGQARSAP